MPLDAAGFDPDYPCLRAKSTHFMRTPVRDSTQLFQLNSGFESDDSSVLAGLTHRMKRFRLNSHKR